MIGECLGPYRIDTELGSGGMGKVYAATVVGCVPGLETGTRVAVKLVHPHLLETPGFFRRFLREAELGARIRQENVVRTHMADALRHGGEQLNFLVLEYVEGQTLDALLRELERVPEELCRHVGREIAKGLAAIHAGGVVHRDLKPANVLITESQVVKVMDLGVARMTDETVRLSRPGAFVGSVAYAAPEQFGGGDVDQRADLHALGLMLYELAAGRHPYAGDGAHGRMKQICESEPRRLGEVNPQLSPFFEELVHVLLAKRPEDRLQSAQEVLEILESGEQSAWWRDRAHQLRALTKRPLRRPRIPRDTAVYGRDRELATLLGLYRAAQSGEGAVVLIEGEAGIGKSRLADELIGRLQAAGEDLNFLFGGYPPGGAATVAGAFTTAFREHLGDRGAGAYLTSASVLATSFDALLGGEPPAAGTAHLTKDSLQMCFAGVTRGLAAERPTVILIDDLHFAPEEGRALFSALASAVPGHRVLLIGTSRPGTAADWATETTRPAHGHHIALDRLGPKELVRLLEEALGSEALAGALSGRVALKSDGNPFFVFEILRGLKEGNLIRQTEAGSWVSAGAIDEIDIPSSVLDLVNARVAELTEAERDLLDVASCWGHEFDPSLIGAVCGLGRIPTLKSFGQIERRHRLVHSVGRHYVFDHHQVKEALYGSINEQLREEYHAGLAEAHEARTGAAQGDPADLDGALCVDLCTHYLMGERPRAGLRYLWRALGHLERSCENAEAVALAERALAAPDVVGGGERPKLLLRLAALLDLLGRRERHRSAIEESERLASEIGDDVLAARAAGMLGVFFAKTGDHLSAAECIRRTLTFARATGDTRMEALATGNLGTVLKSAGRFEDARLYQLRSLELSRQTGDRFAEARAIGNLGSTYEALGLLDEARSYDEQLLVISKEIGWRGGLAMGNGNLAIVLQAQGHLDEALERHRAALAVSRQEGDRRGESTAMGNVGIVLSLQGRHERARTHLTDYLTLCREIGNRTGEAVALHNLGTAALALGDAELGERQLRASLDVCRAIGHAHLAVGNEIALGEHLARSGDADGARERLTSAISAAEASSFPAYEVMARALLAVLPGGDAEAALRSLDEHCARLTDEQQRRVHYLLWRATGQREHLDEARRLMQAAVALVGEDVRASMLDGVPLHRAITAAYADETPTVIEHGEPPTRAGCRLTGGDSSGTVRV